MQKRKKQKLTERPEEVKNEERDTSLKRVSKFLTLGRRRKARKKKLLILRRDGGSRVPINPATEDNSSHSGLDRFSGLEGRVKGSLLGLYLLEKGVSKDSRRGPSQCREGKREGQPCGKGIPSRTETRMTKSRRTWKKGFGEGKIQRGTFLAVGGFKTFNSLR